MKYRILLAHNKYQLPGGEDIGFSTEVEMLREKGHEIIEYIRHNDEIKDYSPFQKLKFPLKMIWSDKTYHEVKEIIKKRKPNIAHFHNIFPLISPSAYYACKDEGIPVIQLLNNYRLICPGGFLLRDNKTCEDCITGGLQNSIKHRCYRDSLILTSSLAMMLKYHRNKGTWFDKVDKYVALSEFSKSKYVEAGFPGSKIVVKPNFVAPDPGRREVDDGYVLFFGRLSIEKGPQTAVKAWRYIENVPLKIVGVGPLEEELHNFVKEHSIKNIEFLSYVPNTEIFDIIKRARFVVIPMEWYEILPRVLIETYACGVPIIASKIGVMADLVINHISGLHFEVGNAKDLSDKVRLLYNDRNLLRKLSGGARKEYETKYVKDVNYEKLMSIYKELSAGNVQQKYNKIRSYL